MLSWLKQYSERNMPRQIFLNQALGRRQFKDVLGTLLLAKFLNKDEVWIVSPWITDFELIDNSMNQWNTLVSNFDTRYIRFSEVLISLVRVGVHIYLVTRDDPINTPFLSNLKYQLGKSDLISICFNKNLHSKGILCRDAFIEGSLNLTYSGVEANDETVILHTDQQIISNAFLEFKQQYTFDGSI